jgi:hypothetical protein
MELEDVSSYLLRNGFQLASLELLAECHQKSITPPNGLVDHFSNPEKFENIRPSTINSNTDRIETSLNPFLTEETKSTSPNPSINSSESIPRSTSANQDNEYEYAEAKAEGESKARLRFQLREALEEIEKLKLNVQTRPSEDNQLQKISPNDQVFAASNLDLLVFDYLERKNYQYSASTMIDEVMKSSF